MKIKSNMNFNLSLTGVGASRILIPALATLEVEDKVAKAFKKELADLEKDGAVSVLKAIELTATEKKAQREASKAAARKLLEEDDEPVKAKATKG